jgi:hypothetical protein
MTQPPTVHTVRNPSRKFEGQPYELRNDDGQPHVVLQAIGSRRDQKWKVCLTRRYTGRPCHVVIGVEQYEGEP